MEWKLRTQLQTKRRKDQAPARPESQQEWERLEIEVIRPLKDRVHELATQLECAHKELEYVRAPSGVTDLLSEYEKTVSSLTKAQALNQQLQAENLTLTKELWKKKI
ncbi:hypothetical protein R1flu_025524 [Riccia fluitans]|uniref:Uncharacterized protein n=1 Tax=Riccia fluitans TaxID=41844 RepID=A0ABD1XY08_9MARC